MAKLCSLARVLLKGLMLLALGCKPNAGKNVVDKSILTYLFRGANRYKRGLYLGILFIF